MAYQSLRSVYLIMYSGRALPDYSPHNSRDSAQEAWCTAGCQETIKLSDFGLAVKLGKRGYVKGDLLAGCDVGMSL